MGIVASEGLRRAAAAAAMVGAISLVFVCELCIEILAGNVSPQKMEVSGRPLSYRKSNPMQPIRRFYVGIVQNSMCRSDTRLIE